MITITKMTATHISQVYEIESHSFSDPWPIEEILWEMENAICQVALVDGQVVGYTVMRHIADEGHIINIATHESHRKSGVSSALMEELIAIAKSRDMIGITLEVRIGNRAAMGLYHKYGFTVEGYRRKFYSYPTEDAAIMWKYLKHDNNCF